MTGEEEKTDASPRLGRLKPRDISRAKSRSAAASRMVGFLRWGLSGLVLAGLVSLVVLPMWKAHKMGASFESAAPNLILENLHFTGIDAKGQAYSVTAARATRAVLGENRNLVDLEKPQAEISLNSGAWLSARADRGRLDQEAKSLDLTGHVEIFHDQGVRVVTEAMTVDMARFKASGEKPIFIQGDFGRIEGAGFDLTEKGKVFKAKGPAHAVIDLRRKGASGKTSSRNGKAR